MKKSRTKKKPPVDEMRPEYRFDYRKAKPNRFASDFEVRSRLVVLDPDIAEVFTSEASVNNALRALLKAIPKPQ